MREILFRGKRIDNGEWVYGDLTGHRVGRAHIRKWENLQFGHAYNAYEVDPETVGQFTGLTDKNGKNGKKIFEGDIVRTYRNEETFDLMMVEWCEDSASFVLAPQKRFCRYESLTNSHIYLEVIGNIHDSLELLRREK